MDTSEEDEDAGLGIVRGRSRRLPDDVKVPLRAEIAEHLGAAGR